MGPGFVLEEPYPFEADLDIGDGSCFRDSMAAMSLPSWGYGIRYRRDFSKLHFIDGRRVEWPYF